MHAVTGSCHCGNARLHLTLSEPPSQYTPRACDCSFCLKHAAAYVSDANGALRLEVAEPALLARYRQGSGSADFLLCRRCGVLLCVLHEDADGLVAAVNFRSIDSATDFAAPQLISPQQLSPEVRIARWKQLWFQRVDLRLGAST